MHEHDELWTGPLPDDLARVQAKLAALPLPPEPDWGAPRPAALPERTHVAPWLALAAGFALMFALASVARDAWRVDTLAGTPECRGVALGARVALGGEVATDAASRARLEVPGLGEVTLEPGTVLRRVRGRGDERRLSLVRGTLHARINAPPRQFVVETSAGVATDLGCAYTLTLDDSSRGKLEVTSGRVAFANEGLENYLPAGLWCPIGPDGVGVPRRVWANERFLSLLAQTDNPQCDTGELSAALAAAEASDAITLWHMLPRVMGARRLEVARRIAQLIEVPEGIAIERIVALDPAALEAWWDVLGVGTLSEWNSPGRGLKGAR